MTTENRRVLRMMCKGLLLVCLPLAGFVWAMPDTTTTLAAAGVLTLMSLVVGFGAEYLASSAENDLNQLEGRLAAAAPIHADELMHREERLRQLDRIVNVLTDQNNTLRSNLVAIQVDVQRRREALMQAAADQVGKLGDAAAETLRPAFARTN